MRYLIVLLISVTVFGAEVTTEVSRELLINKTKNYQTVEKFYETAANLIKRNHAERFCQEVIEIYEELFLILEQDNVLIMHLKSFNDFDLNSYATHLIENSRSDIFSFFIFKNSCKQNTHKPIAQFKKNIEGALLNLKILKMYHQQFLASQNVDI